MEKAFLSDQVVNILQVGLSGFAFLVILMSYFLLKAEQKRDGEPRPGILKSTNRFMWLTILFVLIVGGFGSIKLFVQPSNGGSISSECQESIKNMKLISKSPGQDKEKLIKLIENLSTPCISDDEQ